MGNHCEGIYVADAGALAAIRQAEATADGLLHKNRSIRSTERNDCVKVGHIPALLEHIDVDDNLNLVVGFLQRDEQAVHLFLLLCGGVYLQNLAFVLSVEHFLFQEFLGLLRVGDVATHYQNEGLDQLAVVLLGVQLQVLFGIAVNTDGILQFEHIQLFVPQVAFLEIATLGHRRNLDILTVGQGLSQVVLIDDVLEGLALLIRRSGCHLQAEYRPEFIDGFLGCVCMVAVGFVHQDDQVIEAGQIIKVGLAKVFREAAHTGCSPAAFLAVGVELGNVEYVDFNCVEEVTAVQLEVVVVVSVDDDGRFAHKLSNALEHILFIGRVAEVSLQLFIQRQVGCQDKEVLDAFL